MPNVRESFLRHKLQKWVNCFHIYLPKVHKLFLQHCLETLPHIRQITILGTAAYFVSCVTSITEMSPVTRMSKPKRERSRGDLRAQRVYVYVFVGSHIYVYGDVGSHVYVYVGSHIDTHGSRSF